MEGTPGEREIQILETAEDIQERREQVLGRYLEFRDATQKRRERLEEARMFMYFKRDADELLHMLHYGNQNRTQHPTDANAESSRSHAVFQVGQGHL